MQFQDQIRWTDQEIELQADEASRAFLAFFTEWFTRAEGEMGHAWQNAALYVRSALAETERANGHLSVEWIGQMLLLAREHWQYGEAMMRDLSNIEIRLIQQMEAIKLAELAESAKL